MMDEDKERLEELRKLKDEVSQRSKQKLKKEKEKVIQLRDKELKKIEGKEKWALQREEKDTYRRMKLERGEGGKDAVEELKGLETEGYERLNYKLKLRDRKENVLRSSEKKLKELRVSEDFGKLVDRLDEKGQKLPEKQLTQKEQELKDLGAQMLNSVATDGDKVVDPKMLCKFAEAAVKLRGESGIESQADNIYDDTIKALRGKLEYATDKSANEKMQLIKKILLTPKVVEEVVAYQSKMRPNEQLFIDGGKDENLKNAKNSLLFLLVDFMSLRNIEKNREVADKPRPEKASGFVRQFLDKISAFIDHILDATWRRSSTHTVRAVVNTLQKEMSAGINHLKLEGEEGKTIKKDLAKLLGSPLGMQK